MGLNRRTAVRQWVHQPGRPDETYVTSTTYDDNTLTVTVTDRGVTTTATYDGLNRLINKTGPLGTATSIDHFIDHDQYTFQTNQGTKKRTYQFDTRQNLINISDDDAGRTLYSATFDDHGNLTSAQDIGEGLRTWQYDTFDRLVHQNQNLLNGTSVDEYYAWDRNDRLKSYTDGETNIWSVSASGFDQPLAVTDPLQRLSHFYYQRGFTTHPAGIAAGNGRQSCFRYDFDMRLQYVYNVVTGCADGTGRDLRGPATPLIERRRFTYDDRGNIATITAAKDDARPAEATVSFEYDSLGRKIEEDIAGHDPSLNDYSVIVTYLENGRRTSTQISGNLLSSPTTTWATIDHHYDDLDRLKAVDLNAEQNLAAYDYGTALGRPLSIAYANGAKSVFTYDDRLRQTGIDVTFAGAGVTQPVPIVSLHEALGADSVVRMRQRRIGTGPVMTDVFQVDGDGRVAAENLLLQNVPFPAGEITNAGVASYMQSGSAWRSYMLDNLGNWKSVTTHTGSVQHQMDQISRLKAIGSQTMSVDGQDNLQGLSGDLIQFRFEQFSGALVSAQNGQATHTYVYDAMDRRIAELSPGSSNSAFLWDGDQIVAHGDPTSLTIDVPGDDIDEHIASVDAGGTGKVRYYHQGPEQSVLAVSDDKGLVEGYTYSAFGEVTFWTANGSATQNSAFGNRFLFQGHIFDSFTGTYAVRARQYHPKWGRFLSPDPMSFTGAPSLYSFTGAKPLQYRDPSGMLDVDPVGDEGFDNTYGYLGDDESGPFGAGSEENPSEDLSNAQRTNHQDENGGGGPGQPGNPPQENDKEVPGQGPHGLGGGGGQPSPGRRDPDPPTEPPPPGFGGSTEAVGGPWGGSGGGPRWRLPGLGGPSLGQLRDYAKQQLLNSAGEMLNFALNAADIASTEVVNMLDVPWCGCSRERRNDRAARLGDRIEQREEDLNNYMSKMNDRSRPGKMNMEVKRGQAPKGVSRVDKGYGPSEKDHVHFGRGEGSPALNHDGTWKHGAIRLSNGIKEWLRRHGWSLPNE